MRITAIIILVLMTLCVCIGLARSEDGYTITKMSNVVRVGDQNCAIFQLKIFIPDNPTRPSISYFYGCKNDKDNVTVTPIEFGVKK